MARILRVQLTAQDSGRKYDNYIKVVESVGPEDFDKLCTQIIKAPIGAYFIGEYIQGAKQILELARSWRDGAALETLDVDDAEAVKQDGNTLTLLLKVGRYRVIWFQKAWRLTGVIKLKRQHIDLSLGLASLICHAADKGFASKKSRLNKCIIPGRKPLTSIMSR